VSWRCYIALGHRAPGRRAKLTSPATKQPRADGPGTRLEKQKQPTTDSLFRRGVSATPQQLDSALQIRYGHGSARCDCRSNRVSNRPHEIDLRREGPELREILHMASILRPTSQPINCARPCMCPAVERIFPAGIYSSDQAPFRARLARLPPGNAAGMPFLKRTGLQCSGVGGSKIGLFR